MLVGYGWCVLRSSREPYRTSDLESLDRIDDEVDGADRELWAQFRCPCGKRACRIFTTLLICWSLVNSRRWAIGELSGRCSVGRVGAAVCAVA